MSDIEFDTQEQTEEESTAEAAILDAFNDAIHNDQDETHTKLSMIQAGADFKNVTRLYNKFMIAAGLAISKDDRNRIVEETLTGKTFDTEEDFNVACQDLMSAIEGTTERSAASLIRAYGKKNELEVWAKPKAEGGASRAGFVNGYYDYLVANPNCTKEQATAFIMGTDGNAPTSQNVQNHLSVHLQRWEFGQRIIEAVRGKKSKVKAA